MGHCGCRALAQRRPLAASSLNSPKAIARAPLDDKLTEIRRIGIPLRQRKPKKQTRDQLGNQPVNRRRRKSTATEQSVSRKEKMTREWSLLVRDQDILDLVGTCNAHTLYPLAARFVAIQDAIKNNDIGAISKIERE